MTEWFLSERWPDEYRRNRNANERCNEVSSSWCGEFNDEFQFNICNLPLEETTVSGLPHELTDELVTDVEVTDNEAFDPPPEMTTDTFENAIRRALIRLHRGRRSPAGSPRPLQVPTEAVTSTLVRRSRRVLPKV